MGLLGRHCSHRRGDLSFGRLEDGGLRCLYHGWLYNIHGRCLEQPGVPTGSTFHEKIRHTAYPCRETVGMIFTYMGPGEPPLFPNYEFLSAATKNVFSYKAFQDCNYLQGNEGNFDPVHLSFVHRFITPGEDFRDEFHAADLRPNIEPAETNFGMHLYAIRNVSDGKQFVKVRSFIMPYSGIVASLGESDYIVYCHVPIDDDTHWRFSITLSRPKDLDIKRIEKARAGIGEDYHLTRNKSNRYLQNREEMKTKTFTGMGNDFIVHDAFAIEGQGQIVDRTQENLAYTDRGIILMRKLMLQAIQDVEEGRDPLGVVRDPAQNNFPDLISRDDVLPAGFPWREYWKQPL